ncbi:hypothetical protein A3J61_02520 [Candidatus Nomurabacteria bacterium RIFCSPHIGHO2_02_FULL_38_15]|uniref:Uncharacterized protein n=1 Tax=Candidatus Nomurabacteria bacterium RIFCSPHIGHO2_02_FULL_38_15 TaxID=1801752 RepID=A0A1F6VPY2_9BACT|nr:MAG: hypothetical protein A3J61_02520 [Candidatus Nomurabacteria bacterium RIFCSPHIGHO2_02_FULL_38_15]
MEKIWENFNALTEKTTGIWDVILTIFVKAVQIAFFICFAAIFLPAYLIVTYTHKLWAKMLTDLLKL